MSTEARIVKIEQGGAPLYVLMVGETERFSFAWLPAVRLWALTHGYGCPKVSPWL